MKPFTFHRLLGFLGCLAVSWVASVAQGERDVTFISTSDAHYREPDHKSGNHNALNKASIEEINQIAGQSWPDALGGDTISKPRGVVLLGDVIDDGDRGGAGRKISEEQYEHFLKDFGLTGTEGLLKMPVYEGWGNHDGPPVGKEKNGFSFQAQLKKRNEVRKQKGLISNVSENGLHYSWDWDDIHFVQLNIYPADKQREGVHYNPVWHNPQGSLSFLKADLAAKVGTSGRPVILMSHAGFDSDWWSKDDWADLYAAVKSYNIILYLYGHTGTGVRQWAPPGETLKWDCINDGHTDAGFFVIQVKGNRLRAGYRMKDGLIFNKGDDGRSMPQWDGKWVWRWPLDKKFTVPGPKTETLEKTEGNKAAKS